MGKIVTMKGPVTITNLRNGFVRIEAAKRRGKRPGIRSPFEELRGRPRLHIRADEFMRLINSVPGNFGAL
jgi:hypothetical protein